jgi:hypothetical protein
LGAVRALLALLLVLAPMAAGTALIVVGVARRRAPWPWLVGLGIALVPATYMAAVKLCGSVAGTCIGGDELSNSRQAVVSVVAFALAAGLMALRRTPVRDVAFAALVLIGQLWLLLRLLDAGEVPAAVMVAGLIALGVGYELITRLRAHARTHPATAA